MYKLTSQWSVNQQALAGKREQLFILLREIGKHRFDQTIQRCVTDYTSDYCPPIGIIRNFIPHSPTGDKRSWWRDPNCPNCHGDGWEDVPDPEADRLYKCEGSTAVIRCSNPNCLHRG
jgi:hypothetical protein